MILCILLRKSKKALGNTVVLITSDKDMGQAIDDDRLVIFDPWKDSILNQKAFEEKMGLPIAKLPILFCDFRGYFG